MSVSVPDYSALRAITTFIGVPLDEALTIAAHLVDGACDRASEGDLEHAISLMDELIRSPDSSRCAPELHYFCANAWSGLRLLRHSTDDARSNWRQPELENEILCLRRARHANGFGSLPTGRRAQILTNTGNLLSTVGRCLEAVDLYDEALSVLPNFGMALGNRGVALKELAVHHYDRHQSALILHRALRDLSAAPKEHFSPGAEVAFRRHADEIRSWLSPKYLALEDPAPILALGRSKAERAYRKWALRERLFLNPLLGLGPHCCAASDTLGLPGISVALHEGPGLLGLFSQIKQEFVSARFLAWEGITSIGPHFSDRDTYLVNTLDYAVYGLATEKTKLGFRMAYSILDKCAFLLNKYLALGIKDTDINLNTLWFTGGKPDRAKPNDNLNPSIVDKLGRPFRGLFWLARDIHDRGALRDPIDPAAQELKAVRDHLEHKYLKVHETLIPTDAAAADSGMRDQYARSIALGSLEDKTLTLLRLARSAITYLSLGIHAEERRRAAKRPAGPSLPMFLPTVRDKWKR